MALGTNPFSEDTDGDGLRDDVDPDPTVPLAGFAPIAGVAKDTNTALLFDGVDDVVRVSGHAINNLTDITIEFCLKTTNTGGQTVLSGSRSGVIDAIRITLDSDTSLTLHFNDVAVLMFWLRQ